MPVGVLQHVSDYRVDSIPSWHSQIRSLWSEQSPPAVDRNKLGDVFRQPVQSETCYGGGCTYVRVILENGSFDS